MMEYFWYIIAAAGAGIGTGLAGLSAATVMVPVLIVLCPSFYGETGAYQATAIALASDILGSAVTAYTYWKHQNIDLKRGWIMFVCIICMCTAGSYAAFLAGNVVLGGFTLFLTFCIGIRFLIKPDTSRKETVSKGQKLDLKGILISLFFGLTIGFGTGFVGTGGGMMMLVVFTAFLGMDLKSAVGTSTFIMTFTALIASVSHILIHPAIIMEKWHVMLICITIATIASLYSARFANRVSSRTVGLVTGAVLTVLGAAMIFLNYNEFIMNLPYVKDTFVTFGRYLVYILCFAIFLIVTQGILRLPKSIFRKLLHVAAFTSGIFVVLYGENWQSAAASLLIFAAIVWPVLKFAERWPAFGKLLAEKKPGEIANSLLLLFVSQAILVIVACGLLKKPYVHIAATAAWGLGDIAAAWVGIPFGRHKISLPFADHHKSWEGSIAMAIVAFVSCLLVFLWKSGLPPIISVVFSLITGIVSSLTEMASKDGNDTVTVPFANLAVLGILTMFV